MSIFSRLAALEAAQAAQADLTASVDAAVALAQQTAADVQAVGTRVDTLETEIGTDAPPAA